MATRNMAEKAVHKFREAEKALKDFMSDESVHGIFVEFYKLVEEYNECLDAAVRAVKTELKHSEDDKLVIEGIGAQKKYKRWYDGETLAKLLTLDQAEEVLTEKVVYEVNEERLEQLCRQGEIDSARIRAAYHEEEQNPALLAGAPKPVVLPPFLKGRSP